MNSRLPCPCLLVLLFSLWSPVVAADWKPAKGPLMTRWAKDVRPDHAHPDYPRPQMVRPDWLNLNGLWDHAIRPRKEGQPEQFDGRLLVPFPVESALSGVMKRVSPEQRLWYRRTFELPRAWTGKRVLLHFGAVDWEAEVWLNGKSLGLHRGGYDPFTMDITTALRNTGPQELVVAVWDPTDAGSQPHGKQVRNPRGIWYTPTTGIWQTVWLEPVPSQSIQALKIVPDIDAGGVRVVVQTEGGPASPDVELIVSSVSAGEDIPAFKQVGAMGKAGREVLIKVPEPRLWSPDKPWLYELRVRLLANGKATDAVLSYFGLRKIALGKDNGGRVRMLLNGKPLFQYGPLDQGFWPDGLYTAPTDEALRYDLEMTKKLGFNMVRKHVKVEPARWYHWCDRLGLLVWQDMPSGDVHVARGKGEIQRTRESAAIFEHELRAVIHSLHNHPSVIVWVPFNEGWGQYDTKRIVAQVKKQDPTRLVIGASGWNDLPGVSDVHDIHAYPGPAAPPPEKDRAIVLGEFGGLGLPVPGHTWQDRKNWGYRTFKTREALTQAYLGLLTRLRFLTGQGLSAAVYTQTTDVEIEVNGLLTYDRAIVKMDEKTVAAANQKLHLPPPVVTTVVPTSRKKAQEWRYTMTRPTEGWEKPGLDDSAWKKGPGGFGTEGTPGAVVRTTWTTGDIWTRRTFDLPREMAEGLQLLVHHDEDVEVYLNGVLALKAGGFVTDYALFPIQPEAVKALKPGRNTLAVHCRQTGGGQYIDVGLVSVREARPAKGVRENSAAVDRLLRLMVERLALMREVARWKWNARRPVADPAREKALLDDLAAQARKHHLDESNVRSFFAAQMKAARLVQERYFQEWREQGLDHFNGVADLKTSLRPRINEASRSLLSALAAVEPLRKDAKFAEYLEQASRRVFRSASLDEEVRRTALAPLMGLSR
jgi:chorismate mutase-like protein